MLIGATLLGLSSSFIHFLGEVTRYPVVGERGWFG